MSDPSNCCETLAWVKERIHDKKHFTARLLAQLSEVSGMDAELVTKVLGGILFTLLAFSDQAHFFANAILVVVPFVLIFVYPAEKPLDDSLFVYFSLFGALTVVDRSLERIPCYYILKLALFLLLFMPPYVLHKRVSQLIQEQLKSTEPLSEMSKSTPKSQIRSTVTAVSSTPAPPDPPAEPAPRSIPSPTKSSTDLIGGSRRLKVGVNPMESSSFHNLKSSTDGFNSTLVGNNLNDMIFHPQDKLVFNAPFDYDNLTYHMKVTNKSHHRIAYAVKGNSVPRVMANPAFGIMTPGEERLIAVSVQKFVWNEFDYEKDRIAFDYVVLPDSNKASQFSLELFTHSDTKRRKNIRIEYNP
ncbi:unnamed protein product [Caenorhabditis sp. 36 PRJEB53466]|nr:unnamed protein product [Caenorhabditis sp. 36 PRJEB53466]